VSVDDTEVILRKNKLAPGKQRQRITSCPDPARLKQLHTHNINILDLRTICEQGEQFLMDKQLLPGELFSSDSETDKENEETFNSFTENGKSEETADNDRSIELATVDRLATQFDCCIEEAVGLILSLPDGDYKQDMLHVRHSVTLISSHYCSPRPCNNATGHKDILEYFITCSKQYFTFSHNSLNS